MPTAAAGTESFASALERLGAQGYRRSLRAQAGSLVEVGSGARHAPASLAIGEIVRFEGETDPAEALVLFALRGPDGIPLGTYAALFGPLTPPEDVAVMRRLRA